MPSIKTVECFSDFFIQSRRAKCVATLSLKPSKLEDNTQFKVLLKSSSDQEGSIEKFLYENCKDGELVVAVKGDGMFSFNLQEGELIVVCPEGYDFELVDGELIVYVDKDKFSDGGIGSWVIGESFVLQ